MSYIGVSPFTNTVRTLTKITANGSSSVYYPDGGYTKGYVDVFVSGVKKVEGVDFTAPDSLQIQFSSLPANNDVIEIVAYRPVTLNITNWDEISNKPDPKITLSGDAFGNVILNDLASNTLSVSLANSGVVANSYGNSSQIPVFTVDTKGRITNATTTAVAGVTGFTYSGANNTFAITTGDGSTFVANISANSIAALALGSTGVVANAYGNSTAIPVITIDEDGRISNATTTSVSGVTGVSYTASNSTITVSTSTTDYNAVVNSGNSSVQGLLKVVDSVSNSSTTIAASANSVKTAYELASNAVSNAVSYAATAYSNATSYSDTASGTAYSNAVSQATTLAGTAYSNAVSVAASDATSKAGTAYSNAVSVAASDATSKAGTAYSNAVSTAASDATSKAGTAYSNAVSTAASDATSKSDTAYSNAVSQATTLAGTAYSNAVSQATTLAGTAYSNAVSTAASDATSKAGTAYSNAVSQATTLAGTAYSNAVSQATTLAGTAYSNAVSQATTLAGTAYSNATTFAANADNISSGTVSGARIQANSGIVGNTSGVFVKAGTGITVNTTGVHTNQDISNTANVTFGYMTITGNLVVQGTTTTVNTVTLSVQDNMIYLNSNNTVTNPDLGFAGNYNDGTYHHAGFFRDSTDSRWKVFDNYLPEPDASPYIDTSNTSFQLANFQANVVYANLTGDVTGNVSGSANSATYLGGNTASVLRSYSDTVAGTAYSNAVSVAASDATSKAGTAYSNATSYAATIAGTAYSNAVAYAASNSYVNSTFLPLAGGTMTGSVANATFTTQLTVAGRTRVYGSGIADLSGTGNDTGLVFGGGGIYPTNGALNLTNNTKALGNSSYAFSSINLGTAAYAPIFYDSDNTSYYLDPSSGANLYADQTSFVINGGSATSAGPVITSSSASGPKLSIKNTSTGGKDLWWISNGASNSDGAGKLQLWNHTDAYTALTFASTSGGNHALYGAYTAMAGSARAPLFYDTDNTSYYIDATSTSVITAMNSYGDINNYQAIGAADDVRQGIVAYDSTAMGTNVGGQIVLGYKYLSDGSYTQGAIIKTYKLNSTSGDYSSGLKFQVRDTGEAFATRVWIDPSGNLFSDQSVRAPLFYDYNNTSYYVDPASNSVMNTINIIGVYGRNQTGSGWLSGNYGSVESTATSGAIYSIGGSYVPGTTTLGNMYGIGYTLGNSAGMSFSANWGLYVATNGISRIFLDANDGVGYATGSFRAPIFYDTANTSFYVDPASTSNMTNVQFTGGVFIAQATTSGDRNLKVQGSAGGDVGIHAIASNSGFGFQIYGDGGTNYGFLNSLWGGWNLRKAINGALFLNNQDTYYYGTDTAYMYRVYGIGDIRSPVYYDYSDTNWYVDPSATSVLNALTAVTKSFLINHPTKPGKKLRYACLEGPENGVYVRGKLTNENTIELPEYWTKLVDPDSISVSLTPIGKGQKLSVLDISNNQVVIEEEDSKDINCFYVVYGERVDVDKLEVEI